MYRLRRFVLDSPVLSGFLSGPVFSDFCQVRCDVFCELGWVAAIVVGLGLLRVRVGYGFIVLHWV